jgi:hypothetical protein
MVITAHADVFQRFAQGAEMVFGLSLGFHVPLRMLSHAPMRSLVRGARWASRRFIFGAMIAKSYRFID